MGNRLNDPTGILRLVAALVTLGFFAIYAGSGLVAAGKLFESMFGIPYAGAVIIGAVVVLVYTLSGGFLAVCYTDLIQGILMFIAIVIIPLLAVRSLSDGAIAASLEARNLSISLLPKEISLVALITFIVSPFVWGLGYFGQPHIIVRFMGISSHKALKKSTIIAMIWVVISLAAAIVIGIIGIGMYPDPTTIDAEKVFIKMIGQLCNPWIGGIFLAAIMAAIMSTIDSQLLSASSALSQDFYKMLIRKDATEREMLNVNRIFVVVIMIFATSIALANLNTIFKIVQFAWGGFGAAFGPVILYSLYSRKMTWQAGLAGIIVGTAVMLGWKFSPLGPYMYEILPGFVANLLIITIVNHFLPQQNKEVLDKFDKMTAIIKGNADESEKNA
jgi:sodium/proline symporter